MIKKVSLKDIAKKVGVSVALVSYVLNDQKTDRISKETAIKIKEAALKLNYRGNFIARSLKTNKTFTIGLIVADISNPFFSGLARIIEDEAAKNGYTVIIGSSDENVEKSKKLINVLLDHQVDGFIIAPTEGSEGQVALLQKLNIPVVLIDRNFPKLKTAYIIIDNYLAAYKATSHIINTGRTRIGMITFTTKLLNLTERKKGFLDALKANNIRLNKQWIKEINILEPEAAVKKAIGELISLKPSVDAIFFTNNILSTHGLIYINSLSVRVPDDISIVSFDESVASDLFYAPVTHIKQPLQKIGQGAIDALMDLLQGKKVSNIQLKAELIVRKSTQP
ncbi:MAG TPA: LacI family DNA-binding transcriptional regulator [Chitinophagaceae bacterium]|nr:LacI family DNA-binding transcriptional regulator [Chitinophagaceae bacterium]